MLLLLSAHCALTHRARVSLRSRSAIVGLNRYSDGSWRLHATGGVMLQAKLLSDSYLHPELLVLNFAIDNGRRRSVVLARDSADRSSLRRLRVALAQGVRAVEE